jgi:hypothetical protein
MDKGDTYAPHHLGSAPAGGFDAGADKRPAAARRASSLSIARSSSLYMGCGSMPMAAFTASDASIHSPTASCKEPHIPIKPRRVDRIPRCAQSGLEHLETGVRVARALDRIEGLLTPSLLHPTAAKPGPDHMRAIGRRADIVRQGVRGTAG